MKFENSSINNNKQKFQDLVNRLSNKTSVAVESIGDKITKIEIDESRLTESQINNIKKYIATKYPELSET